MRSEEGRRGKRRFRRSPDEGAGAGDSRIAVEFVLEQSLGEFRESRAQFLRDLGALVGADPFQLWVVRIEEGCVRVTLSMRWEAFQNWIKRRRGRSSAADREAAAFAQIQVVGHL